MESRRRRFPLSAEASMLLSLLVVDLVAAMVPGPNFVLVSQSALQGGRRNGMTAVLGIMTGNVIWSLGVAFGFLAMFAVVPALYKILKLVGGAYLIYLGITLWLGRGKPMEVEPSTGSTRSAYTRGLLTTLLNPKCAVYFGSVFTLFMRPSTPSWAIGVAIVIVAFNSVLWYGSVALLFSADRVRRVQSSIQRPIDRIAGTVIAGFGAKLIVASD
jgi:threonine efflux protein